MRKYDYHCAYVSESEYECGYLHIAGPLRRRHFPHAIETRPTHNGPEWQTARRSAGVVVAEGNAEAVMEESEGGVCVGQQIRRFSIKRKRDFGAFFFY